MQIDQSERGTGHFLFVHPQRTCDAFHKNSFACAERAIKQNNLTTRKLFTDAHAEIECLLLAARDPFAGGRRLCCAHNARRKSADSLYAMVRFGHGISPSGSSVQMAAPRCSRMSE